MGPVLWTMIGPVGAEAALGRGRAGSGVSFDRDATGALQPKEPLVWFGTTLFRVGGE